MTAWQEGTATLIADEIQDVERLKHGLSDTDRQKMSDRAEALRWAEHLLQTYEDRAEYVDQLTAECRGFFDRASCGKYRGSAFNTTAWAINWVLGRMGADQVEGPA